MSSTILFSSNIPTLSTSHHINFNKRHIQLPIQASSNSISYPQPPPFNLNYLKREFSSHGVSFTELGNNYVMRLLSENGSAASILMPSGLITSYKPKMWHGSSIEVLHTCVSEEKSSDGGGVSIQGGVSLALNCVGEDGFLWSPLTWVLNDVNGSSDDSIQVEIVSQDIGKMVEVKYNITLKPDTMISEVTVMNSRSSKLELTGSILTHLTVSTPDATYAYGLEGSNFVEKLPLMSDFSITPTNLAKRKDTSPSQSWPLSSVKDLFAKRDVKEANEDNVGEEDENYKHLSEDMSRIYTSAPRNFTIIDRGKRNSVMVGRKGFEELYMYSPGSSHESYGKYAYVCVGQSAVLRPIRLGPDQLWRGEQHLHNPNL
ncbi:unnamed protein product [Amaranthus hypochondriacus]